MKKLTAALAACFMFICAASCGGGKEKESSSEASSGSEVTTAVTTEAEAEEETAGTTATSAAATTAKQEDIVTTAAAESGEKEKVELKADIPEEAGEVVRAYLNCAANMDTAGMLSCFYPKDIVDGIKSSGVLDDFSELMEKSNEPAEDLVKNCVITEAKKMDETGLMGSRNYFRAVEENIGADKIHDVKDGYFIKAEYTCTDESDGTEESISIVLMDSGEWVIMPLNEEDLAEFAKRE